ncbi:calcium-binding protein [Paracoccus aminovorans]|uniref:calcium-binding protein n=1 Tax=Paracoccus aminovorans TaxID=34004 RepID=UPI000A832E24|nr:calcium-binding protein [Paracoccus aminovorans]
MIIRNDTVWRAGEVIELNETVQIAAGATLTIEEGAVVRGGSIQVFGTLSVEGTQQNQVTFDNVRLTFGSEHRIPARLEMAFTNWAGGEFLPATGNGSYGSFSVSDSTFNGTQGFYIWYPTSESNFTRNLFVGSSPLSIGTGHDSSLTVEANSFVNIAGPMEVRAAYGEPVIIRYNTFSVPNGAIAVEISAPAIADENYWGTVHRPTINSLILDANDDLNRGHVLSIANPLATPYPGAPSVSLYVRGIVGNDVVAGMSMGDQLWGFSGNDALNGLGGADTLNGGRGADTMTGGMGNDTYIVDDAGDIVNEVQNAGSDTVHATISYVLGGNLENLILTGAAASNGSGNTLANHIQGNAADNLLNGNAGNDTLIGGAGNDRLLGGIGVDSMAGGIGNDFYQVIEASDLVVEVGNQGNDTVQSAASYALTADVENLVLAGTANINGTGNALANRISGNAGNNTLLGGLGNDTLLGGAGNDTRNGGTGDDRLDGGAGVDLVAYGAATGGVRVNLATAGAQAIGGGQGSDTLSWIENVNGSDFADVLTGNVAANLLSGVAGNDTLVGGAGTDTLSGGLGTDTAGYGAAGGGVRVDLATAGAQAIGGGQGSDLLLGIENLDGSGFADRLWGNLAANRLNGSAGNDQLDGRGGNDSLLGGAGADSLLGGAGNDVLTGGAGADRLNGGLGADQFVFLTLGESSVAAAGRDLIQDFSRAQGDRIDLCGIDAHAGLAGDQAFRLIGERAFTGAAGELRYERAGNVTTILADSNGDGRADFSVALNGSHSLAGADFLL